VRLSALVRSALSSGRASALSGCGDAPADLKTGHPRVIWPHPLQLSADFERIEVEPRPLESAHEPRTCSHGTIGKHRTFATDKQAKRSRRNEPEQ